MTVHDLGVLCFVTLFVVIAVLWIREEQRRAAMGHRPTGASPVALSPPRDTGTVVVTPAPTDTSYNNAVIAALVTERLELQREKAELANQIAEAKAQAFNVLVPRSDEDLRDTLDAGVALLAERYTEARLCLAEIAALPVEGSDDCYSCARATTLRNSELAQEVSALTVQLEAAREARGDRQGPRCGVPGCDAPMYRWGPGDGGIWYRCEKHFKEEIADGA